MMSDRARLLLALCLKAGAVLLVANEVRGLVLVAPILYGMVKAGGSAMAIWIGLCSLGGVALSVAVPMLLAGRLHKLARSVEPA
jgi:hypothetical protein